MKFIKTDIEGLILIRPKNFKDERGVFFESFNKQKFNKEIKNIDFVQDNISITKYGVFRGFHYQRPPKAQAKLIQVIQGAILDIVIDLRKSSSTFKKSFQVILSDENQNQLFIPKGFAHGFLSLSKFSKVIYKTSDFYYPEFESTIKWNDPELGINLNIDNPILSKRDQMSDFLNECFFFD